MAVRTPQDDVAEYVWAPARFAAPSLAAALSVSLLVLVALVSNGRPIVAGDTRPTERVAASLVLEADLDLDEYPDVEPPFAKTVAGHRVSIYPALSAVLAAPVFALARMLFALDETGLALAGKVAAALFSSLAAGTLFLAVGRRHPERDAFWAAVIFALGTSVWSTSQALWQHPAAVLFLCIAILCTLKAEDDAAWAGRAGLPLSLAVAARHADVALAAVLALGLAIRWPRRLPFLVLWSLPGIAFVLGYQWLTFGSPLEHGFSGGLGRFSEPSSVGHLGLLVSPAKGLLVFTPVAAVAALGLVRAFRAGERGLASTLGAGALAHWLLIGRWSEWHGGESWGPRLMTDALPLLFFFLPDGLEILPRLGPALAAVSVAIQALGAFAYDDYRWERLYQRPAAGDRRPLWDPIRSPIFFYARERVIVPSIPFVRERKAVLREYRTVVLGPKGSRIVFERDGPVVRGSETTFGDAHLLRGARVQTAQLLLRGRWDGLFLRVRPGARVRPLELRLTGRGRGPLYVGEKTFWSDVPRWREFSTSGAFRLRHPYYFPESGGDEIIVTVGRGGGEVALDSIALVAPTDPEEVLDTR